MLGHRLFRDLSKKHDTWGSIRGKYPVRLERDLEKKMISGVDGTNLTHLKQVLDTYSAELIINCIGIIKQKEEAQERLLSIQINSLLPHFLDKWCTENDSRLIHFSTDCVFSGKTGGYTEESISDCYDTYGRSKYLGEVVDSKNSITLRTSIIGREIKNKASLLEWFLAQEGTIKGYSQAVFSGFPTATISKIIADYVIPTPDLWGLYHLASHPINKLDLLHLFKKVYKKTLKIEEDDKVKIERSLNGKRFEESTGYRSANWEELALDLLTEHAWYEEQKEN